MSDDEDDLRARLTRAEGQVRILEEALRDRSKESARINHSLRSAHEFMRAIYRAMPGSLFVIGEDEIVEDANDGVLHLLAAKQEDVVAQPAARLFDGQAPDFRALLAATPNQAAERSERTLRTFDGRSIPVMFSATPLRVPGERRRSLVCVALDISERKRIEAELRQAQKLESVGRLAAGVAHEINTPLQFISDSVHFVRDAVGDLFAVLSAYQALRDPAGMDLASVTALEQRLDVGELRTTIPESLDLAIGGLARVATIVRSMNLFAHPHRHMKAGDLDGAIRATLTLAASEYKLVADLQLDLVPLPMVVCSLGDISQVVLNLVVNAAHAIADVVRGTRDRGMITVRTRHVDDHVTIAISDTGGGIPDTVREHIFDPFFTTKSVGHGTGQGLAIARTVVCEMHRGELTFDTVAGRGTTFTIRLPLGTAMLRAS